MIHAVLIVEESEFVIIGTDAVNQIRRIASRQSRTRLPVDDDAAKIENDIGD